MDNDLLYRRAAARVELKLAFYRHLMVYVVVNIFLAILNLLRNPDRLWFQWVIFGWGIGLLSHWLNVFSYRWMGGSRERMIQRELEREAGKRQPPAS
jgi:hypothetical protein